MARRIKYRTSLSARKLPPSLSKSLLLVVGFVVGYGVCESQTPKTLVTPDASSQIQVCFSPEGNCEKQVIKAIQSAKTQILVQAYAFTSPSISQALIEAYQKGITVKVLYDHSQVKSSHSKIPELQQAGILTKVDQTKGLAHNKVMIIDHSFILTGSFNWTRAANTKNAENLLLIHNPVLAQIYETHWWLRYQR